MHFAVFPRTLSNRSLIADVPAYRLPHLPYIQIIPLCKNCFHRFNMSHRDKRPRLEITNRTDDYPPWKFMQVLDSRINTLEALLKIDSRSYQKNSSSCKFGDTADMLQGRVSKLEERLGLVYQYPQKLKYSGKKIVCPADSCNCSYKDMEKLHSHIRKSQGVGHQTLLSIIDQKYCFHCEMGFTRNQDLFHHEKTFHHSDYETRIESFLPYYWQPKSKRSSTCLRNTVTY